MTLQKAPRQMSSLKRYSTVIVNANDLRMPREYIRWTVDDDLKTRWKRRSLSCVENSSRETPSVAFMK